MFKSVIERTNVIQKQLMQVGGIVDLFEQKNYEAVDAWLSWLKKSEKILKDYNYNETSQLSGLRANIIAELHSVDTLKNRRKKVENAALSTIDPAQNILYSISVSLLEKIEQVRTLIRQILIPAKEAGIIQNEGIVDFNQYIESLLQQFKNHDQLKSSISNAIALIGKYDVMRIIAEELDLS